jgi:host factor-I protein
LDHSDSAWVAIDIEGLSDYVYVVVISLVVTVDLTAQFQLFPVVELLASPHNQPTWGDRHMDNKPAQNIQDTFLNTVRKDKTPITIYLVSGVKLTGKIRSFDKYSVLLENNSQEQLIFKHAISTVVSNRAMSHSEHRIGSPVGHTSASGPAGTVPGSGSPSPASSEPPSGNSHS